MRPAPSSPPQETRASHEDWTQRYAIASLLAMIAIAWCHALAAILRRLTPIAEPPIAAGLTIAALGVALTLAIMPARRPRWVAPSVGVLATALLWLWFPQSLFGACALLLIAPTCAALSRWLSRGAAKLSIGGVFAGRRRLGLLWALLMTGAVFQVGRLATELSDPSGSFVLATTNPFWAGHECLPAYLQGAELNRRGDDNLYHAHHYPALDAQANYHSDIEGMRVEDPYQYPPQFLLLSRGAIALTQHYPTIRVVWFALQLTLFLAVALRLTLWIGGWRGTLAAMLLPLTLVSFPALYNLQYGQFHLPALALSVAALLCFDRSRHTLGGALLGIAIMAKVFPGVLAVMLAAQRRWRELAWTTGAIVATSVAALLVLGPVPFAAFFNYQLPRLQNGAAFAFAKAWPEIEPLVIADNQGAFGLVLKLGALGVNGASGQVAAWFNRGYGLILLLAVALLARRESRATRDRRACIWLALLGLASLASTGAFGDYVPVAATWMLPLLAVSWLGRPVARRWSIAAGVCFLFQCQLIGTTPIGEWFEATTMTVLSALSVLLMLSVFARAALTPRAAVARVVRPGPSLAPSSHGVQRAIG